MLSSTPVAALFRGSPGGLLLAASLLSRPACGAEDARASPFTDYRTQKPGVVHYIAPSDLPRPMASRSVINGPSVVARPEGAWPKVPAGFRVTLYASGLENPRQLRVAPNGDLFVAESRAGRIRVLRGLKKDGSAQTVSVFATGLDSPFGLAFHPPGPRPRRLYVGNTGAVVRFDYSPGELKASGPPKTLLALPSGGWLRGGGHWTRDLAFSLDGKRLFISVGSYSNNDDTDRNGKERRRANVLAATPEGEGLEVYAWGLRNPVGLAVDPRTGELWTSVNERDGLGDRLPPDYITRVQEGGFYGWPWFYIGANQDPRHKGKHPELKERVLIPDVLLEPHNASLGLAFYEGNSFPARYRAGLFAAQHGSWNRSVRTGYEVIFVPLESGRATGRYEDFMTGFVTPEGDVWGRPVGVAAASDGALFVSDDASGSVWRIEAAGNNP